MGKVTHQLKTFAFTLLEFLLAALVNVACGEASALASINILRAADHEVCRLTGTVPSSFVAIRSF